MIALTLQLWTSALGSLPASIDGRRRQPAGNRDYVLATVKAIEAEGFRDTQLHRLAAMLHDAHALHAPGPGGREAP